MAPNKYVSYIANHACRDTITDEYFEPTLESVRRVLETVNNTIMDKIGIELREILGKQDWFPHNSTQPQATDLKFAFGVSFGTLLVELLA